MAHHRRPVRDLPHALDSRDLAERLAGVLPAVFLDYDGTLTPIVDHPDEATISDGMRESVRRLAQRCPVCIVSGRDRRVVQQLMGMHDLVVAGSHGFDIWDPTGGHAQHEVGGQYGPLLREVQARLTAALSSTKGALVEPKARSVAVHYRMVAPAERGRVEEVVRDVLRSHPDELRITDGRLVYEFQPNIDWNKGKAVLHLLQALGLDREGVLPLYLGDDITDEDAFEALAGRGVAVLVGRPGDAEFAGRSTAADYILHSVNEVERFLDTLGSRLVK